MTSSQSWSGLRSMRTRMTALFALLVVLLMMGVVLGVVRFEHNRAQARVEESLQLAMERARHELGDENLSSKSLLRIVQSEQGEITAGGFALLVTQGDKVIWSSQTDIPSWPRRDENWSIKTLPVGQQTLVIARPLAADAEELRATALELVVIGLAVVVTTAILAWFVVGQTLSPIVRLADQAQNATLEGVSVRLQTPSSDAEMRLLTGTLNHLLGRLEREAQGRAHFYAAASHELRTPIQIMLGEIEVVRSRSRPAPEYEDALDQVYRGTERLSVLVQDLLQLNALEMRQNQAAKETINLAFWIERAVTQQGARIETQGLSLETQLTESFIEAPPAHAEVLLRNLVENAVKYATPATVLRISLSPSLEQVHFEIDNDCHLTEGVQLDEWFEPFYRPDESRWSQTGGNGLGLAICRAICVSNGWDIALLPRENGLATVVKFPKS